MIKAMRFGITWKILAGNPGQVWSRGQLMDKSTRTTGLSASALSTATSRN